MPTRIVSEIAIAEEQSSDIVITAVSLTASDEPRTSVPVDAPASLLLNDNPRRHERFDTTFTIVPSSQSHQRNYSTDTITRESATSKKLMVRKPVPTLDTVEFRSPTYHYGDSTLMSPTTPTKSDGIDKIVETTSDVMSSTIISNESSPTDSSNLGQEATYPIPTIALRLSNSSMSKLPDGVDLSPIANRRNSVSQTKNSPKLEPALKDGKNRRSVFDLFSKKKDEKDKPKKRESHLLQISNDDITKEKKSNRESSFFNKGKGSSNDLAKERKNDQNGNAYLTSNSKENKDESVRKSNMSIFAFQFGKKESETADTDFANSESAAQHSKIIFTQKLNDIPKTKHLSKVFDGLSKQVFGSNSLLKDEEKKISNETRIAILEEQVLHLQRLTSDLVLENLKLWDVLTPK